MPPSYPRRGPNRRDRWRAAVIKSELPSTTRLFLSAVLSRHMNASGIVSHPRKRLAAEVGASERRVAAYVQQAKEGGWLIVVQPGYRGMTAVYQATFPDAKRVSPADTQTEAGKGVTQKHPFRVSSSTPISRQKGDDWRHPKVGTYVPTEDSATSGKSARGHHANDDALKENEQSIITSRREAPTTDVLVESLDLSSSFARRHLRAVGE